MSETRQQKDRFDVLSFILEFEDGELEEERLVEGFQHLIDSGQVWQLQGFYGRTAIALLEAGLCHPVGHPTIRPEPKPEKIGTHCECGAPYVFLVNHNAWGYQCNR